MRDVWRTPRQESVPQPRTWGQTAGGWDNGGRTKGINSGVIPLLHEGNCKQTRGSFGGKIIPCQHISFPTLFSTLFLPNTKSRFGCPDCMGQGLDSPRQEIAVGDQNWNEIGPVKRAHPVRNKGRENSTEQGEKSGESSKKMCVDSTCGSPSIYTFFSGICA